MQYLRALKTITFSTGLQDGEQLYYLQGLVDTSKSASSQVPGKVKTNLLNVDTEQTKSGIGKVFFCLIFDDLNYHLTWMVESFTDYLIQYAGAVVKNQEVTAWHNYEIGWTDFIYMCHALRVYQNLYSFQSRQHGD